MARKDVGNDKAFRRQQRRTPSEPRNSSVQQRNPRLLPPKGSAPMPSFGSGSRGGGDKMRLRDLWHCLLSWRRRILWLANAKRDGQSTGSQRTATLHLALVRPRSRPAGHCAGGGLDEQGNREDPTHPRLERACHPRETQRYFFCSPSAAGFGGGLMGHSGDSVRAVFR